MKPDIPYKQHVYRWYYTERDYSMWYKLKGEAKRANTPKYINIGENGEVLSEMGNLELTKGVLSNHTVRRGRT